MCLRQGEVGGAAVPGKQNVDMDAKRPSHAFRAHAVTTWRACREARGPSTAQLRLRASTPPMPRARPYSSLWPRAPEVAACPPSGTRAHTSEGEP